MKPMRLLALLPLLGALSCTDPEPSPPEGLWTDGVFVVCEGLFGSANGRLDYVGRDGTTAESVFRAANGALPPGDVPQSMRAVGTDYWLVVNNAGTAYRLDGETLAIGVRSEGHASPRFAEPLADGRLLVTDLFGGAVAIVDPGTGATTGSLDAYGGWTERMAAEPATGRVWVADRTRHRLRATDGNAWVDSVDTGTDPESLVRDADGLLWVLCTGGFAGDPPALQAYDADGNRVRDLALPVAAAYPNDLQRSPDGRTLYWLAATGVFRMAIDAPTAPDEAWIPADGRNGYALGCDPATGQLWLADAVDYASAGIVSRYDAGGTLLATYPTGINPGHFCFTP